MESSACDGAAQLEGVAFNLEILAESILGDAGFCAEQRGTVVITPTELESSANEARSLVEGCH